MKLKQLTPVLFLIISSHAFAASSHPVTFQNNAGGDVNVNYLKGHAYSKCVSYVDPAHLTIPMNAAKTSVFEDRDSRSCLNGNKRASWEIIAPNIDKIVITLEHKKIGTRWRTFFSTEHGIVATPTKVYFDKLRYALDIKDINTITILKCTLPWQC
ncbi:hypothetical protein [Cysteiniphilum sp. QT6929]|uniref:hypothetical protein n=1 Tax=Cysteiniphilum sp. QT6929 TaxID=2975055 RepID=UPI0024B36FDC|nr:hypothetical protein [Cysteiniphilum sp. QT6929]WHN66297.1 hypothetical protein NYP54_03445 [Cysteiniphilum sp. QT6929]